MSDTLSAPPPFLIRLLCPKCGLENNVERHPIDPAGATVVVIPCPDCRSSGMEAPTYFDAHGKRVPL